MILYKSFSPEWKLWIWTNIVNGFSKESIFNILLNHGFEYNLIKNELEIEPTNTMIWQRQYNQEEFYKPYEKDIIPLKKILLDNSNVYRVENNFLELYRIPEFITYDECDGIIQENEEFINIVNKKADLLSGLNTLPSDIISVKTVLHGEKIIDNKSDWGMVIFLENVFEDSLIEFPKINIKLKPEKGEALLWNNIYPDKTFNPNGKCISTSPKNEGKLVLIKTYTEINDKIFKAQQINIDNI